MSNHHRALMRDRWPRLGAIVRVTGDRTCCEGRYGHLIEVEPGRQFPFTVIVDGVDGVNFPLARDEFDVVHP